MTAVTKEILDGYQIRKSKKQKQRFREYVRTYAQNCGYEVQEEKAYGGKNLIVGDPERAKVVFTAHYDTCAAMPFPNFITPKSVPIYVLSQLAIVVGFLIVAFGLGGAVGVAVAALGGSAEISGLLASALYWVLLILLIAGPANKHTVNDNTSGVTLLLELMAEIPEEMREQAAFVFFDLEEMGLFGSSKFAEQHKKTMKDKLLLNFDCVSDGENILFVLRKKAGQHKETLEQAFASDDTVSVEVAGKGVIYPSDQINFPVGVGVAALKKSKKRGILYMDRIHTRRDVIYRKENIAFLKEGSIRLLQMLS